MPLDLARIEKNVSKLRKTLKQQPREKRLTPDFVHKLRVGASHVEGLASALPSAAWRDSRRILKPLKRIRQRAGSVRDADVLTALLASVHSNGATENSVTMLEYLGAHRHKRAASLRKVMQKYRAPVRKELKWALKRLDRFAEKQKTQPAGQTPERTAARVLQLSNELAEPRRLDRNNLHACRKIIKDIRYLLQMEKGEPEKIVRVLGECKDAIGEWHDWEELIAETADVLGGKNGSELLTELRAISGRKLDHALAVTNKMRSLYFKAPNGGRQLSESFGLH